MLAATVHDGRSEVLALNGLTAAQIVHGEVRRSLETGRASVELVNDYPELITACEMSYAGSMMTLGMHDQSVEHFERAVRAYLPGQSTMAIAFEPGAFAMSWESHALWLWGAPGRAVVRHREAMELATTRGPHSLALANAYGAVLFHCLGDEGEMEARARAAIELCERYGFAYYGEWGQILLAWRERNEPGSRSVARIEAALESLRSIGAELRRPHYLAILAQTHIAAGDLNRANSILGAAVATAKANEDVYWLPEIYRLIAELGPESNRDTTLRMALDLARTHGSRSLALRAAISLVQHTPSAAGELENALKQLPAGERSREVAEAMALLDLRTTV
jgi:tetratricopeptide (TPR) repeat protein